MRSICSCRRFSETGISVRSSCACSETRNSSSIQRSCRRAGTAASGTRALAQRAELRFEGPDARGQRGVALEIRAHPGRAPRNALQVARQLVEPGLRRSERKVLRDQRVQLRAHLRDAGGENRAAQALQRGARGAPFLEDAAQSAR